MKQSTDEALGRLASLAAALNERSEEVNAIIRRANDALSAMNLGLSFWLGGPNDPTLLDAVGDTGGAVGLQLGFAKVDDRWQLATRLVSAEQRFFQGDEEQPWTEVKVLAEPGPLIKASRLVRVEACRHLDQLFAAMSSRVETLIKGIDDATSIIGES